MVPDKYSPEDQLMDLGNAVRDLRHARLVKQTRNGDRKAFRTLYGELHGLVFDYLDRRLSDIHDTEDLVSIVFHKMIKNMERFDSRRGSVTGWLMTMARHALIDHLRRQRDNLDIDGLAEVLASSDHGPLEGMIRTEEAEWIRGELGTMPTKTQELVALRYGEGLRCGEIAAMTGLTESAVKQQLSRAVRELRQRWTKQTDNGGEVDYATR